MQYLLIIYFWKKMVYLIAMSIFIICDNINLMLMI